MKTFAWILCLFCIKFVKAQVERYDVVINEIMADPSPIVGLPNAEYIELKNISGKTVDLNRFKIDNGSTSATIANSYFLQPDSMVIICSRTQTLFFGGLKVIGITSFPVLANEGDLITLKSPDGKTIHAVEYKSSWYGNPVKANGGWSLEMIDPLQPCADKNWMASVDTKGGTPGRENSIHATTFQGNETKALQCIATSPDKLLLILDQGVDSISALSTSNYQLNSLDALTLQARINPPLFKEIELTLSKKMEMDKIYVLEMKGLNRCKSMVKDTISIRTGILKEPEEGDLVINEILFNPPPDGSDYVEVRNNSSSVINAKGLYFTSKNDMGLMGVLYPISSQHFNIFPGESVAVSTDTSFIRKQWKQSRENQLIECNSLPSMPDEKGNILMLDAKGMILDELKYAASLHFPLLKDLSAVSLERINPHKKTSSPDNWHSAAGSSGYGTPGEENSQFMREDSLPVMINIKPDVVSPNNDGYNDLLVINYKTEKNGSMLNVYLFNENGQFLSKPVDNKLCGTAGSFYWDGLSNNLKLKNGFYIIMAELVLPNGKPYRYKKLIGIR